MKFTRTNIILFTDFPDTWKINSIYNKPLIWEYSK